MRNRVSGRDWEMLSAYLDGELPPREQARLEDQLNTNSELRAALEELRRTRSLLRSQPLVNAPRNFTLNPEMVGKKPEKYIGSGLFPVLRLTSVLASLLFAFVIFSDFLFTGQRLASPMMGAELESVVIQQEVESTSGIVSKSVEEESAVAEGLASSESVESESALDLAEAPVERAPALEMPSPAEVEYPPPAEESLLFAAPMTVTPEPTQTPQPSPTAYIVPAEERLPAERENVLIVFFHLDNIQRILRDRVLVRFLEVSLALVALISGLVAVYTRPARKR